LQPIDWLYSVVGVVHVALALGLVALSFRDRLNRVFALYLFLLGSTMIVSTIQPAAAWQRGLSGLFWYLNLGSSFPLLYLAACYRDRFGNRGLRRPAFWVLSLGAAVVQISFFLEPSLALGAGVRPLKSLHLALVILAPSVLAALLAHDALASSSMKERRNLLLASLGFAFYPTAFGLHLFVPNIMVIPTFDRALGLFGLAPAGYIVWRLVQADRREASEGVRRSARTYLAILALSPVSVLGLFAAEATLALGQAQLIMRTVMTLWLVVLMVLVGYAILRHELFGIEIGVKWTIRRGAVPGLIVAAFFVVGQMLESIAESVTGDSSWVVAAGAAAVVSLAYMPLQRYADRLAQVTMPHVDSTPRYKNARREDLFESALAAAWEDGILTREERLRLDGLRERLLLTVPQALAIEEAFVRRRGSKA
jgi:hypothetical protein